MPPESTDATPYRVAFVLLPEYSFIAFSCAVEPLRMANRLSGRELYSWRVLTVDGEPVAASNGLRLPADGALADAGQPDLVLVCGGENVQRHGSRSLVFWLRKLAHRKVDVGGLCTASSVLAGAGLLDGYRCTIHWENLASLREEHPEIVVSQEVFEIDRDRLTCAGGTAPLDMILTLVGRHHGDHLAVAISEEFICERIRGRNDRQRIPLRLSLGTSQPKLVEAVSLMEANLEEPMSLDELARHVGLSRRQLERLFQKHLNCVPTRYYLELRLVKARQLLLQTSMSIVDVAFACGFVSAPHFSKCYRDYFGIPPRDDRRLRKPPEEAPANANGAGAPRTDAGAGPAA